MGQLSFPSMWLLSLILVLLSASLIRARAGKVLMTPSSFYPEHRMVMRELAGELIKRGHQVVWWEYGLIQRKEIALPAKVEERFWPIDLAEQSTKDLFVSRNASIYDHLWEADYEEPNLQITAWLASSRLCDRLLETRRKDFDKLVAEQFDTVVVDDLYNPCGLLLAELKHSVFVYWSMTSMRTETAWANQSPSPPSYIPVPGTGLTDELDFGQRAYNLVSYLKALYIHQRIVQRRIDAVFQKHFPGVLESFYMERNASINLINTPPIFDFARPYMPRVNFVGGLHCHKANELPADLSAFVSGASGFVVFTTGYNVEWKRTPQHIRSMFTAVFKAKSDLRFIWQYNGPKIPDLPKNVHVAPWLPQQDLLGHPKCKGFISTGGLNSVIEAMWHGVPVVGIPLTKQTKDNLLRATARGAGIMLEKEHLDEKSLLRAIKKVTTDAKYKDEAVVFQDLLIDVPYTELNHSAFWVEFIMRHQEVPHARSGADHLNVFQYFLVDVISFLLCCLFIILVVTWYTMKLCCRACCCCCKSSYNVVFGKRATKTMAEKKNK